SATHQAGQTRRGMEGSRNPSAQAHNLSDSGRRLCRGGAERPAGFEPRRTSGLVRSGEIEGGDYQGAAKWTLIVVVSAAPVLAKRSISSFGICHALVICHSSFSSPRPPRRSAPLASSRPESCESAPP